MDEEAFVEAAILSSLADETPEGKSIIELFGDGDGKNTPRRVPTTRRVSTDATFIKFTAETRSSGMDMADGTQV